MKIKILKDGLRNRENGKPLKKGDVISVTDKRGEKAVKIGNAEEVKPKKSKQDKISEETIKK